MEITSATLHLARKALKTQAEKYERILDIFEAGDTLYDEAKQNLQACYDAHDELLDTLSGRINALHIR